ncbi:MAG: hypothetical protein R2932_60610 [Caldilineaceae bacterium]
MTRNEIFNVVKSAMISIIDEIDETTEINESDRMADLGADSIDVVGVVSDSIRSLRVKVDRVRLDSTQNIAGLLDLLEEAVALKNDGVHNIPIEDMPEVEYAGYNS